MGRLASAAVAAAAAVSLQLSIFSPTLRDPDCPCSYPHIQGPLIEQPCQIPTLPLFALSYQKTHIHAHCLSCILINTFTINSSRQWPGWLADWLAADKAQTQPAWPCRHKNSGGDKLWPPATSSSTYVTC